MNYLPAFLSPKLVEALGWTILHSLWQGALVAVLLSVLMILLHRHSARTRYAVAMAALFFTLFMAGVTFIHSYNQVPETVTVAKQTPKVQKSTLTAPANAKVANITTTSTAKPVLRGAILVNFKYYFSKHLPLVVLVWLLGMLTMLLKFLGGLAYVQRLKHYKTYSVGLAWHTRLTTIAQRIGIHQSVRLLESAMVKTPMVIGYLKPVILLPFGTVAGLSPDQVEAILAHELAHVYRKDYLLNMLQTLVEILFFFNPATWWISDYVRIERENCCDDQAIALCGNSLTYARALTNLQAISGKAPQLAMGFAGKDGSLLGRIKRLVQQPGLRPTFSEGFLAACVLMVGLTVFSVSTLAGLPLPEENLNQDLAAAPVVNQKATVSEVNTEASTNLKASIYSITDSLTGEKSDLIIIKNKKGEITELYVDGQKIPKSDIADFRKEIDAAMATTRQAPTLKSADKPEKLAKTKKALKKLETDNDNFSFSFEGDFDDFDLSIPAPAPVPALAALPPAPPMPPMPTMVAPPAPKKPLEYLKTRNLSANTLYIIDGNRYPGKKGKSEVNKLNNDNIRSVQVYSPKAALDEYGKDAKDGAVVIETGKQSPLDYMILEIGDDNPYRKAQNNIYRQQVQAQRQEELAHRRAEITRHVE